MLKYGKGIFSTVRCEKDKKGDLTRESQIVRYRKHTWANWHLKFIDQEKHNESWDNPNQKEYRSFLLQLLHCTQL